MERSAKRAVTVILSSALVLGSLVCDFGDVKTQAEAASTELTGKTAEEITADMGFGWNLGNTFDATGGNSSDIYSQEQSWGNPIVTKTLIEAVSNAGFTTIRIPVTWYNHISDDGEYTIDEDWLARIQTILDYAYEYDMYVILNVHHEDWINTTELSTNYVEIGEELAAVWGQIATYFADYDQHLIFEGMNEPRLADATNEWTGDSDAYVAVNYLNQIFVTAVRSSGEGHNDERCLMIPAYAASNSYSILSALSIPTYNGEACNNLIISVHAYSPYNFCLSDTQTTFDASNSSDTSDIETVFETIDKLFLSQGIPVVIGETGATNSGTNTEARAEWAAYMSEMAAGYGVPIILWDNGYDGTSGGECHSYIDRETGEQLYPTIISAFLSALEDEDITWGSLRSDADADYESILGGTVIWFDEDGVVSSNDWSYLLQVSAESQWFMEGRQIAVVYTGSSAPQLILDSDEVGAYWIPVSASDTGTVNGKKVAYFDYEDLVDAYEKYGVTFASQLRYINVIAPYGSDTIYEVSVLGDPIVTFMVNGEVYAQQAELPEDPTMENMEFAGWYTSKTYDSGTEYTGGETLTKDITVYAKFTLATESTDAEESTSAEEATNGEESTSAEETSNDEETTGADETEVASEEEDSSEEEATSEIEATSEEEAGSGEETSSEEEATSEEEASGEEVSSEDTSGDAGEDTEYDLGDVNSDGKVDYLDAMMVLRYDAMLVSLTDTQRLLGDVNGDGTVDSLDAIRILRYDAGLIEIF